jgi:hypothetical protein
MGTKTVRIRRLWAAYLAVYAVLVGVGVYPYLTNPRLTMGGPPRPFQVMQTAVDILVMYGLFGLVVRRSIRQVALRVALIIVAAFLCVRVVVVLYVLGPFVPTIFPWRGDAESFISITLLLGVPLQLPAAFALWQ